MFFFSSLTKFFHGGYVTVFLATAIFIVMFVWRRGTAIEHTQSVYLPVNKYIDQLKSLSQDNDYSLLADNLVFLTNDSSFDKLDRDILYSILDKRPKRARTYCFINISVTDKPNTREFVINDFGTDFLFKVTIRLGFKENQRINTYLYQIIGDLIASGQLAPQNHKYSIYREHSEIGDFRFCLLRKVLAPETDISGFDKRCLDLKYFIRRICGSPARWYGLENSNVIFEYVPLFSKVKREHKLTRVTLEATPDIGMSLKAEKQHERIAEIEEDDDIFSAAMHKDRIENAAAVHNLVGGDTASFKPLKLDEEDEDEGSEVEGETEGEELLDSEAAGSTLNSE